jgi:hypothetical protein
VRKKYGYVYVAGPDRGGSAPDDFGAYKIGRSARPDQRLVQLRWQTGDDSLPIIHQIATLDAIWLEHYLHVAFRGLRVSNRPWSADRHREWFYLKYRDLAALRSVKVANRPSHLPWSLTGLYNWNANTRDERCAFRAAARRKR